MVPKTLILWSLLVTGAGVAGPITTDSPFLPTGAARGEAATTSPTGVEFCGIVQRSDGLYFGFYESSSGKGRWLRQGQEQEGWVVRSFEPGVREVTLEIQGQPQVLALKQPRLEGGAALPVVSSLPPGVVAPVAAPSAADEAARLKSVADEIKRRRALRAAALNGQNPPPAQPPGQPPLPPPNPAE